MTLVRSPVRSVVRSPVRSVLGDAGGGGTPAFDLTTLSRYVDIDVKDRANLDGSGATMSVITDQGSAGFSWTESPWGDGYDYDDDAGTNSGAPGAVRRLNATVNRYLWTNTFTAGTIPDNSCVLWVGKPPAQVNTYGWLTDANNRNVGVSNQVGVSAPGLNVGDTYVNNVLTTTQAQFYTQSELTDGNDTYPFSYFRVEDAMFASSGQFRYPYYANQSTQGMMLARMLIIDQSEYDANKDGIDAAMIALRDEYRAG